MKQNRRKKEERGQLGSHIGREWLQVLIHFKQETEILADTPVIFPPSWGPSSPDIVPCWYNSVASQMISKNRTLCLHFSLLPFAKSLTAWKTQSSYHHCTTQEAKKGSRGGKKNVSTKSQKRKKSKEKFGKKINKTCASTSSSDTLSGQSAAYV